MSQGIQHGRLVEGLPEELLKLTHNCTESLVVPIFFSREHSNVGIFKYSRV